MWPQYFSKAVNITSWFFDKIIAFFVKQVDILKLYCAALHMFAIWNFCGGFYATLTQQRSYIACYFTWGNYKTSRKTMFCLYTGNYQMTSPKVMQLLIIIHVKQTQEAWSVVIMNFTETHHFLPSSHVIKTAWHSFLYNINLWNSFKIMLEKVTQAPL